MTNLLENQEIHTCFATQNLFICENCAESTEHIKTCFTEDGKMIWLCDDCIKKYTVKKELDYSWRYLNPNALKSDHI